MGIASRCSCPTRPTATPHAPGIDPFEAPVDGARGLLRRAGLRPGEGQRCATRGVSTHGHYAENDNYGGAERHVGRSHGRGHDRGRDRRLPLRCRATCRRSHGRHPDREARQHAALHQPRGRRRSTTRSPPAPSPAWARRAPRSRSPTARRAPAARRLRLDRARLRHPRHRPGQADPRLGPARHPGGRATSPARSSPTSAASTRSCAARSRSPSDRLEASGPSATLGPARLAGPTSPRTCRSTSCRARTTSTSPPPPTAAAARRSWRWPTRETERWRRQFGMTRRAVRAHRRGDGDRVLGDRRGAHGAASATTASRTTRDDRRLRPRMGRPQGAERRSEPARRVHLRRPVPPRRPRRRCGGSSTRRSTPSSPPLAAVSSSRASSRRPPRRLTRGGAGELDPIENLSRFHYLKELFLDSATTCTVLSCVPDLAGHQQPAADRRGGRDGRHRQPPGPLAARGDARLRDAEPRRRPATRRPARPSLAFLDEELELMMERAPTIPATSCAAGRPTAPGATSRTPAAGSSTPTPAWRSSSRSST